MSKPESRRDLKEAGKVEEISLQVILKFIKPYDGNRERLTAFLRNCDSAISLASSLQEDIVFNYIISQLEGKAESACSIKDFDNWASLKEFLKNQFGERKHYAHLLTDLQDCRQGNNESVSQFSLRIETCLQKLLTEITVSNTKKSELAGRVAAMEDLALHTFTLGLHPGIATVVRCREPKDLNDAINCAISEEKIRQFSSRNNTTPKFKFGDSQRNNNFSPKPRPFTHNFQPSSSKDGPPFCRYCKKVGHVLENCRIRDFNNKKYGNGPQPFSPSRQFDNNRPRVTYAEQVNAIEQVGTNEVDEPLGNLN